MPRIPVPFCDAASDSESFSEFVRRMSCAVVSPKDLQICGGVFELFSKLMCGYVFLGDIPVIRISLPPCDATFESENVSGFVCRMSCAVVSWKVLRICGGVSELLSKLMCDYVSLGDIPAIRIPLPLCDATFELENVSGFVRRMPWAVVS